MTIKERQVVNTVTKQHVIPKGQLLHPDETSKRIVTNAYPIQFLSVSEGPPKRFFQIEATELEARYLLELLDSTNQYWAAEKIRTCGRPNLAAVTERENTNGTLYKAFKRALFGQAWTWIPDIVDEAPQAP